MLYHSTRGNFAPVASSFAIHKGMVPGGGLFVPESFPTLAPGALPSEYPEIARAVLSLYLTDYSGGELQSAAAQAYGANFDARTIAPVALYDNMTAYLELWHGPTAAFKDLALQLLPHLLRAAAHKQGSDKEIVILVATSGDTGKAAIEGFKDVAGTRIIVFYPKSGVSPIQEKQMVSTDGVNTTVIGVQGNFDDCQNMVKEIFDDAAFTAGLAGAGFELSSANSINWGRLVPQIAYYYHAYLAMAAHGSVRMGEPICLAVPTGNFGNILAAYYAKLMGLPVSKLICASNANRVLTDFFESGVYDTNREFICTSSPSMDILISSNLERFLYAVSGNDAARVADWQKSLAREGRFSIGGDMRGAVCNIIAAESVSEADVAEEIRRVFTAKEYLLDTHTAVASAALARYRAKSGDATPAVIAATASPYKVCQAVYDALAHEGRADDEYMIMDALRDMTGVAIPQALRGLDSLHTRHERVITISEGRRAIRDVLQLSE
jgi:threonine synthase